MSIYSSHVCVQNGFEVNPTGCILRVRQVTISKIMKLDSSFRPERRICSKYVRDISIRASHKILRRKISQPCQVWQYFKGKQPQKKKCSSLASSQLKAFILSIQQRQISQLKLWRGFRLTYLNPKYKKSIKMFKIIDY